MRWECVEVAQLFHVPVGAPLADPSQFINGTDGYKRQSHEFRISSPQDNRFRFVAGRTGGPLVSVPSRRKTV